MIKGKRKLEEQGSSIASAANYVCGLRESVFLDHLTSSVPQGSTPVW